MSLLGEGVPDHAVSTCIVRGRPFGEVRGALRTQGNLIGLGHSPAGPNETGGKAHPPKTKDSEDKTGSGDSSDLEDHPGTTQKFKRLLKCQAQDGD